MGKHSFSPEERLHCRADYLHAGRCGRRQGGRLFSLILCPTLGQTTRLGVTASRKVGNAVRRNRVKRLVREFFRLNKLLFPPGHDAVVIARAGAPELSYREVETALRGLLSRRSHAGVS